MNFNVIRNALKPGFFPIMVKKIVARITEPNIKDTKVKATEWCRLNAVKTEDFLKQIDAPLYRAAKENSQKLNQHGAAVIEKLPVKMGGGGNTELLYFLTRYLKPEVIVETGVSMGFSSHAFLTALQENGSGTLYSSDFPYFRLENPEKYIGCVVEEKLKTNWTLLIDGDEKNLKDIGQKISSIDLFHYDSDKSYAGRQLGLALLKDKLSEKTTIIFDDIGDNYHFRDFVNKTNRKHKVLESPNGGFVGIVGPILK